MAYMPALHAWNGTSALRPRSGHDVGRVDYAVDAPLVLSDPRFRLSPLISIYLFSGPCLALVKSGGSSSLCSRVLKIGIREVMSSFQDTGGHADHLAPRAKGARVCCDPCQRRTRSQRAMPEANAFAATRARGERVCCDPCQRRTRLLQPRQVRPCQERTLRGVEPMLS